MSSFYRTVKKGFVFQVYVCVLWRSLEHNQFVVFLCACFNLFTVTLGTSKINIFFTKAQNFTLTAAIDIGTVVFFFNYFILYLILKTSIYFCIVFFY